MSKVYTTRVYVQGHCVMGDNDIVADSVSDARAQMLAKFNAPAGLAASDCPHTIAMLAHVAKVQALAREYGLLVTASPSRAKR